MRKAILIVLLLLPSSALAQTNYQFTGQELDQQSQLYYYGQRYYDPQVGRFIQADPMQKFLAAPELEDRAGLTLEEILANPQRLNAYSYSLNNPVNVTDPTGEVSEERQERFNKISNYIVNDENYWLIRDRDGNTKALDAIWQKSLKLAENNVGNALDTFYDAVHLNWRDGKTLDASLEAFEERLVNLPNALSGEYGGNRVNIDKLQHFAASARLTYKFGGRIAGALGRLKEVQDGFRALFSRGHRYRDLKEADEGYSRGDIGANQTGIFWMNEYKAGQVNPSDIIKNLF